MLQHISEHGCHQPWGARFSDNSSKSLLLIIFYVFRLTLIMYRVSWHTPQCRTRSSVWKGSLIIYYVRMTKSGLSQGSNTFFLLIFHMQQVIQWMWLCIISCIIVHSQWQRRRKWCELKTLCASRRWLCPNRPLARSRDLLVASEGSYPLKVDILLRVACSGNLQSEKEIEIQHNRYSWHFYSHLAHSTWVCSVLTWLVLMLIGCVEVQHIGTQQRVFQACWLGGSPRES